MVYHADTEIEFFYIKSWNTYRPTYCVYFESKIELDRFVYPNNYTRTHWVHDDVASQHRRVPSVVHLDLLIRRITFFLLNI